MYVTIKLDDKRHKIHSISDGDKEIVTEGDYFVMPWNMVSTRCGANMTLKEAAELIKKREEERTLVCEFEAKHNDEIIELLNVIDFMKDEGKIKKSYPELYEFGIERLGIHFNNGFVFEENDEKGVVFNQLYYFRGVIRSYQGLYEAEKVKSFIDKPLDELEIEDVREIRKKLVKFPPKLEVSVFYELTGRLPHEELEFAERDLIIHFYDTFVRASKKLLGKPVRYRVNVLYHLLRKIDKEPKANSFTFMKGSGHKRTEEEIKFVFEYLGWDYSPIVGTQR